ncbi:hypothetical protein F5B19DRAFT_476795 [Rostrohypoxylon terebratum]|nr:hypothetical protein F5B19DRAFT_476795 [Rostrohypoxylon terebratum]
MDLVFLWAFLGGILYFFISRLCWCLYRFAVSQASVEGRNELIPYGRHLQRRLGIPVSLRIIAERDPGLSDHGIRLLMTAIIFLPILSMSSFVLTIPTAGTVFDRGVWLMSLGVPICMGICIYIVLLFGH